MVDWADASRRGPPVHALFHIAVPVEAVQVCAGSSLALILRTEYAIILGVGLQGLRTGSAFRAYTCTCRFYPHEELHDEGLWGSPPPVRLHA